MEDYETVLLVKPEVFVFKIPPRATNRGYRAADWKLDAPDWTGRLRIVSKGKRCFIKLEDKNSGELFAKSPVDAYPGVAVESVMDSSRYFVLRIEDDDGRAAFIGIGFADRADSFDLNVALQEHFKWLQKSEEIQQELDTSESKSNLNLGFKEGETITINMNIGKKSGSSTKPRPKPSTFSGTPGLLPPPPGGVKLPAPPASRPVNQSEAPRSAPVSQSNSAADLEANSAADLLLDFALSAEAESKPASANSSGAELWGDFTTASGDTGAVQQKDTTAGNWIDF